MIDFKPITIREKNLYEKALWESSRRGCEYSFGNAFLWGALSYAVFEDQLLILARYGDYETYFYPLGKGDKTEALAALMADAQERGIPCRISGMVEEEAKTLATLYPGKFRYKADRNSFDYIYEIDALADLRGKKLQSKRNHFNRFKLKFPDYRVEPLSAGNVSAVRRMAEKWFQNKDCCNPEKDFELEKEALAKALDQFEAAKLVGLVLWIEDQVAAFTVASRFYADTFDVHFEKADTAFDGAYTAINCEFARYLREQHPEVQYLDREEDMGLPGLRKAKLSYRPHHLVEKVRAVLL